MADLTGVVQLIKSDLPNTKARLKKQTYRSVLVMKKRNQEIEAQLKMMLGSKADKDGVFSKPRLTMMIERD